MKKTNKNTSMGMAMGMCLGVSIGTSVGTVFDNISIGSSMGLIIGMMIGLVIGVLKDEKVNKQVEERGYIIKHIEKDNENKIYSVTITDKWGEETSVSISEGEMEEESFEVGDVVFLDDEGMIEQAFDKDDE